MCDIIVSHGLVMQVENALNYLLVSFNYNHEFPITGVGSDCAESSVQWKEQFTNEYVQHGDLVYSDNHIRDNHVCKASVGDNEIPGYTSPVTKKCLFIHNGHVGFATIYQVLIHDATEMLQVVWMSYNVGEVLPSGAFRGGRRADGTLLYVCRAFKYGSYIIGYYDPDNAIGSIHAGSAKHPVQLDLLGFFPNGPTSAGPTVDLACPRFHIIQAYREEVRWVEHRGPVPMPTGVVLSSSSDAAATSAGTFSTIAKFADNENYFCMVYRSTSGCQTWGHLMLTSFSYRWVPFQAGSEVPYNAIVAVYTPQNQPLYYVMSELDNYAIGSYNAKTGQVVVEYFGIQHPPVVKILTLGLPLGSLAWTDDGYYRYSGPITAIRIQHGTTITGIQCRFGAQWSAGFWSTVSTEIITEVYFRHDEYMRGVEIGLAETMGFIKIFTNLNIFGPFGAIQEDKNHTMFTSCGYIHHFSGYLIWDENIKKNKTFSFAVYGQTCK